MEHDNFEHSDDYHDLEHEHLGLFFVFLWKIENEHNDYEDFDRYNLLFWEEQQDKVNKLPAMSWQFAHHDHGRIPGYPEIENPWFPEALMMTRILIIMIY